MYAKSKFISPFRYGRRFMYLKRLKLLSIKLSVDNLGWTDHELITLSPPATNPPTQTITLVD